MKYWLVSMVLVTMMLVVTPQPASASGRLRLWRGTRPAARQSATYPNYSYRSLNQYYPRYYGGFHARYFQTLGVPGGDVGLRGNGIYATP